MERYQAKQLIDASYREAGADRVSCRVCGRSFRPRDSTRMVCSAACAVVSMARVDHEPVARTVKNSEWDRCACGHGFVDHLHDRRDGWICTSRGCRCHQFEYEPDPGG